MSCYFEGTLISTVITKQKIYLLSDGKLTNSVTGISKDDHSKVHSINEKVGILVAGRLIPNLPEYIKEECQLRGKHTIKDIANFTQKGFKKVWTNEENSGKWYPNNTRFFSFITGFDSNKKPRLFYVDSNTTPRFEIKERTLFDSPVSFEIAAIAEGSGSYNPTEKLRDHIQNNVAIYEGIMSNDEMICNAFDKTKNEISQLEPKIGGQTFFEIINL